MTYIQLAYIHLATILPAFMIGTFLLFNAKGTRKHRLLGKIYMVLMLFTAGITLLMPAEVGPTLLNHFGFIHLFSFLVIYLVPSAYVAARNHQIKKHKGNMMGLYIGGLLIAGSFTFAPGRLLNQWLIM